jgi:hypothetical protein
MRHFLTKGAMRAAILVGSILGTVVAGAAGGFIETDLVANTSRLIDSNGISHTPAHVDPNLLNAWGLTASSTSPFWVSDNGAGVSTLYDAAGVARSLVVSIPAPTIPATPLNNKGTPTGVVFNIAMSNEAPPQTDEACILASHSGGFGSLIWRTTDKSRLGLTKYV